MQINPDTLHPRAVHALLNAIVVPRPIAWVSTMSPDGVANLAPHSYATIASLQPPTVLFVSIGEKDTVRNARAGGEFVYHVADRALAEQMNLSSASVDPAVSEFDLTGLTRVPSVKVDPPRVAEAAVALECVVRDIIPIGNEPSYAVLGEVVLVHVDDRVALPPEQGWVDAGELGAIARMGGSMYSTTSERFSMARP